MRVTKALTVEELPATEFLLTFCHAPRFKLTATATEYLPPNRHGCTLVVSRLARIGATARWRENDIKTKFAKRFWRVV